MRFIEKTEKHNKLRVRTLWIDAFAKIGDALVYFLSLGQFEGRFEISMIEWRVHKGLAYLKNRKQDM